MTILIVFYWIICGLSMFSLDVRPNNKIPIIVDFALSMLLGGLIVPVRLIADWLR